MMSAVTLAVCPEHGLLPDQSKLDPSCECGRRLETVEYVPAEQLRGAVEALKLIAASRAHDGQHAIDVALARNALEAMGVEPFWRGQ
jgi:hypothetical protein